MSNTSRNTASIVVRESTRTDADGLAALHRDAWHYAYRGIIPGLGLERMIARRGPLWWKRMHGRGGRTFVLEFDGRVMGYVSFGMCRARALDRRGEIYEIYVRPEAQGVGFGKRLFAEARRRLRERGLAGLVVWSLAENEIACRFYEAQGGKAYASAHDRIGGAPLELVAYVWP